ncbi:class II glutamine amidotransferase [Hydrogenothermus marinus]|uniref:Glutamine amidotransferase n=1 Tax=Hydrogenothermus marinus TaxID=133270 RepID=A0A3M0BUS3_9AQUI|nr:class II glutamine amidotransferase [Hydrogenothermus marinus]RMB00050.1 glutamine amidotransferase [Hydrogenothermus marinus]
MCELLGIAFNKPIKPTLSFRGFRHRGEINPHGWGIAYYPDTSVQVIKEPIKAGESSLSEFIKNYPRIKSKIFISHVRYTSVGSKSHMNTHPFQRELNGKEFVFAHNGTLHNYKRLSTGRFRPVGETDSEHIFCYILNRIEERNINRWTSEDFRWLWDLLKTINKKGTFNCIFSDGEHLFCYHDEKSYNGLCFVHRKAPFNTVRLEDEDFEINLSEEKEPSQKGFIIATRPLTNERWENFHAGELIVFRNGNIVFSSSNRDAKQFSTTLNEIELNILRLLRQSPHRLSFRTICDNVGLSREELLPSIYSLLCKRYIKQDSRDRVKWDHDDATFYTEPSKRSEIDGLIRK